MLSFRKSGRMVVDVGWLQPPTQRETLMESGFYSEDVSKIGLNHSLFVCRT